MCNFLYGPLWRHPKRESPNVRASLLQAPLPVRASSYRWSWACQTFHNWKKKYDGLGVSELRQLKQLEAENSRLKKMVADLSLDKEMLQEVIQKSSEACSTPQVSPFLVEDYRISTRRAVGLDSVSRSHFYYRHHPRDDRAERARIREIAESRVRYGMWRIHTLMRREGWLINHKKTHLIYCDEGLNSRRKRPRRRVSAAHRMERPDVSKVNDCWSMEFVADNLFKGRRIRALIVVDNFSRECLAITVDYALRGGDVMATTEHVKTIRGLPRRIQVDNGSEFISKALDLWAYENKVTLDFSRPGKPTDNPHIESFNGSFRDECLNLNWFLLLEDAQEKIEVWRVDYNEFRPHQ